MVVSGRVDDLGLFNLATLRSARPTWVDERLHVAGRPFSSQLPITRRDADAVETREKRVHVVGSFVSLF